MKPELKVEYEKLWATSKTKADWKKAAQKSFKKIQDNWERYEKVGKPYGVPPEIVGVIHMMESGFDFTTHLHNGDSLKKRTVQVPKGRPIKGTPPFTWEESAMDALNYDGAGNFDFSTVAGQLYFLEQYNGWGYRTHGIHSPYLWSGTNHYTKGKYIADGKWSATAISKQLGCVPVLRELAWYRSQNESKVLATVAEYFPGA